VTSFVENWSLWVFQYCTQWGYLTASVVTPLSWGWLTSNHPRSSKDRIVISRLLDIGYEHKICVQAVPRKDCAVLASPNVTVVILLGSFHIEADRSAFMDGEGTPVTRSPRPSNLC
jgi:hypothetical protein